MSLLPIKFIQPANRNISPNSSKKLETKLESLLKLTPKIEVDDELVLVALDVLERNNLEIDRRGCIILFILFSYWLNGHRIQSDHGIQENSKEELHQLRMARLVLCDDFSHKIVLDEIQCIALLEEIEKVLETQEYLSSIPYKEYLKTNHWQSIRKNSLKEANYRCRLCNREDKLDVHHRTYERIGCELPQDVLAICRDCHSKFHKNVTVREGGVK